MSTIAIKTGTRKHAGSNARVVVEICDSQGTCCQTSSDGRGLDNPGQDREIGQTDVYTNSAILGNCAQEVINILTLGQSYIMVKKRLLFFTKNIDPSKKSLENFFSPGEPGW